MTTKKIAIVLISILCSSSVFAADYWQRYSAKETDQFGVEATFYGLETNAIRSVLQSDMHITVPAADGTMHTYALTPSRVLPEALARKYPQLQSYVGVNVEHPQLTGRFDWSHRGMHAMFDTPSQDRTEQTLRTFIDPVNASKHRVYQVSDETLHNFRHQHNKLAPKIIRELSVNQPTATKQRRLVQARTSSSIITYRLAITATGDYSAFIGAENKADVMAELTAMTNRLNEVFLVEVGARFELVSNNDDVVFLDAETDPFNNDSDDGTLNRDVQDNAIGVLNYDIGHVVNSDGGGLAVLNSLCSRAFKADGLSGIAATGSNDAFWVDIVAHELGHQFGATHTFNSDAGSCDGNGSAQTAVEPGSGSTIMSYAGLCSDTNVSTFVHDNFHAISLAQMLEHRQIVDENQFGFYLNSCGTVSVSGNNHPEVDAGNDYTIPANTYFELTATASDVNPDDVLTYSWEQIDAAGFGGASSSEEDVLTDQGTGPLIRARTPSVSPSRHIPDRTVQRSGNVVIGEVLPTTSRTMDFSITVRDNQGGVARDEMTVTVDNTAGPLEITTELSGQFFETNPISINWNVNDTDAARFNCATLDAFISINGGVTYDQQVASNLPNNGSASINLPITNGRQNFQTLMLKCSDNIFFASHRGTFSSDIEGIPLTITGQSMLTVTEDASITLSLSDFSTNETASTLTVLSGTHYTFDGLTVTPSADFNGNLSVNVQASAGANTSASFAAQVTVTPVNDPPTATSSTASFVANTTDNVINLSVNDVDGDTLTITEATTDGNGTVVIAGETLQYTPEADFTGSETISYTVSDGSESASATVTVDVTPEPVVLTVSGFTETTTQEDIPVQISIEDFTTNIQATGMVILSGANYTVSDSTITPSANFNGTLAVNVQLSAGDVLADVFVANITVDPVNDAPVVNDETRSTTSGTAISINVLTNDTDVDNDTLSVTSIDYSGTGSATLDNNIISYTSAASFTGTETITYVVTDGTEDVTGTITITVTAPPVSPPSSGGGGGGSMHWLLLLGLFGLTLQRRFSIIKDIK
ncbi:tandem-95 repeat protein [Alteromonas sp. LMIT006]|uniref:tandem-95 repeat protein n=1 Tax=Alteromonadaceae TaxID=72275 RepID=UPI0020CA567F|nr:tandem-95 repeat protein [Alteromonas sp. LMIT006]UTP73024.1 tandem-95 repeat protein [Alteromonas sp. LMIT006]